MAEDTKTQIEQRLAELPEDVGNAVLSAEMGEHVRAIGQRHGLHIDQIGKLEDETMLVMLGFFDPSQFNTQIEQQLLIPAADAEAIATDISTQVFAPIRASLESFMQAKRSAATTDVRMSSSVSVPPVEAASTPVAITKIAAPMPTSSVPTPTVPVMPQVSTPTAPVMPTAEKMLTEKTANVKPIYKTDPYREPIE